MKKLLIMVLGLTAFISCKDTKASEEKIAAERKLEVDSINAVRTKYNDSILALRDKNKYEDLSGNHTFTMSTQGISVLKGTVVFKKTGGDQYEISGKAQSGNNTITINGKGDLVKPEYLNFEGEITQNIAENGKAYTRKGDKTFAAKGNKQFWRLQDMTNSEGFVDYIDIHFK